MSPPAWGWPVPSYKRDCTADDVPTRVGMARNNSRRRIRNRRCPHPRGDGPQNKKMYFNSILMSPPAWGWPAQRDSPALHCADVPTRVGMARGFLGHVIPSRRCPHPRGDGPDRGLPQEKISRMSPPAWGWPGGGTSSGVGVVDVPTRVGMARPSSSFGGASVRCPHPRGDGPW